MTLSSRARLRSGQGGWLEDETVMPWHEAKKRMMYVQFGFNVKLLARLQPVKRKHPKHVQRVSSKAGSAKQLPGHRRHLRRMLCLK